MFESSRGTWVVRQLSVQLWSQGCEFGIQVGLGAGSNLETWHMPLFRSSFITLNLLYSFLPRDLVPSYVRFLHRYLIIFNAIVNFFVIFLLSFCGCRNAVDISKIDCVSRDLVNLCTNSNNLLVILKISENILWIMIVLFFFLPILTAFISFSCFLALTKTLVKCSREVVISGISFQLQISRQKLHFTAYMILVGFFVDTMSFIRLRKSSSSLCLLKILVMNECWMFFTLFPAN